MEPPVYTTDAERIVEATIERVGPVINLAAPLGIGKANHVINAFYRKAKADPSLQLNIMTALTLERPKGTSLLQKRFLEPFVERVFGNYPDLEYEIDRGKNALPKNIRVIEFYFPAGKYLRNAQAQQDYVSSNYTHVARDVLDRGVNVVAQLIAPDGEAEAEHFSLSSNSDLTLDIIHLMQQREAKDGTPFAVIGQVNPDLPYMYGDAVVDPGVFDFLLDDPECYYKIFGPPKQPVPLREHAIGMHLSTLIRDEGELQVGIGALGDAFIHALLLRHTDNATYLKVLDVLDIPAKFGDAMQRIGETGPFEKGLFGATEMVVDGFLHLFKGGILKRVVYDDLPLQRLINEGLIDYTVTKRTLALLLERKAIHMHLSDADYAYLVRFGIFRDDLHYADGVITTANGLEIPADFTREENRAQIFAHCLGTKLKNGAVVHGGFFLGPTAFYEALKALPEAHKRLFNMRSVRRINQLYGHEAIDRLQRKNARFVNTCMMATLSGAMVSDGLEDGRVVSGVGGQYNFVSMAHALPDGRSLINLRATRESSSGPQSNIVWNYGHITIPRHLRDVIVTEYGIANLRGKTDAEVAAALIQIADSRFQQELVQKAKAAGKLPADYEVPGPFRNNYPEVLERKMKPFSDHFPTFPFGTDLTDEELVLGKALKTLKKKTSRKSTMAGLTAKALLTTNIPENLHPYLSRMGFDTVNGFKEKLYRNLLVNELKAMTS